MPSRERAVVVPSALLAMAFLTAEPAGAFSPPVRRRVREGPAPSARIRPATTATATAAVRLAGKLKVEEDVDDDAPTTTTPMTTLTTEAAASAASFSEGLERVFDAVDADGSGGIDLEEYNSHLSSAGYSEKAIKKSFLEIDADGNGEISKEEFQTAISGLSGIEGDPDCPMMGYWLNSVRQTCEPLGPIGRVSQRLETLGPLKRVYAKITNLFGVDRASLRRRGVPFLLAYSIVSNLNGAVSLSVAWYLTVRRTGASPLVPGGKRSLLASYAMIYGALQLLKPFRVAAAVAMSKLSADWLDLTQDRLGCSRNAAIGCQYAAGLVAMGMTFSAGVTLVSLLTGVPIWG